jgi:hypothetical protein
LDYLADTYFIIIINEVPLGQVFNAFGAGVKPRRDLVTGKVIAFRWDRKRSYNQFSDFRSLIRLNSLKLLLTSVHF